jgi:hypothetical protein
MRIQYCNNSDSLSQVSIPMRCYAPALILRFILVFSSVERSVAARAAHTLIMSC